MDDEALMKEALAEAKLAFDAGEIPVGAVVVKDGKIVGRGHNTRERDNDVSGHAEINALKDAGKNLGDWDLSGCSIYVTLEPCAMCGGAIMQSRLRTIVYGESDPQEGGFSKYRLLDHDNAATLVHAGVLKEECRALLDEFFRKLRH